MTAQLSSVLDSPLFESTHAYSRDTTQTADVRKPKRSSVELHPVVERRNVKMKQLINERVWNVFGVCSECDIEQC